MAMQEYITLKALPLDGQFAALSAQGELAGAEVFCADLVPREEPLFHTAAERDAMAADLCAQGVRRLHASYWASPTAFLSDSAAVEIFGSEAAVAAYYGDCTGQHLFHRWSQEYDLACAMKAQAFTFHLIDYFPIDGLWRFTLSRETILAAMASMTNRLLETLSRQGLLTPDSPRIELENAGWGLEYGVQTAEDFEALLRQVSDPLGKLCIGWDINHLLHALGNREGRGMFFLPKEELTPDMAALQAELGGDPAAFALAWLRRNLLAPALAGRVACVHLSDCGWKQHQFFTQGYLEQPWRTALEACATPEEMEHVGEQLVLTHYDSHLPLGQGCLDGRGVMDLLHALAAQRADFVLLHELKNAADPASALAEQRRSLKQGGL